MSYLGDFDAGDTIYFKFTTVNTSGVPTALSDGYIAAYKDGSTTETLTGVTLTASFDSRTGLNHIAVDTSQDGTFYAVGSDYQLVVITGSVDGSSIIGYEIGAFSLRNRANLYPTTAGRTLDVSAGGEAGLDWANIGSPTTAQNLSGTNIDVDQVVASVSGNVGGSVASVAAGGITAASIATDAIDADALAADAVAEIQSGLATAASIAALNNLSAAQVNAEVDTALADVNLDHLVGTATGIPAIPAGTYLDQVIDDGTATYDRTTDSLQAIRDRGDSAWITATGFSTLDAAGVRTAVGLASANLDTQLGDLPTAAENADAVWDEILAGHVGAGSTGEALNAAGAAGDPWTTALPGAYGAGSAGNIIGNNLNATVSSRASQASLDTLDDFVDTEVAAILADTNELQTDWADGGRLDVILDARASQTSVDTIGTNVNSILADTGTDGVVVAAASKTGYTLSAAGVQAIWDALTSALTTVGSVGKLLVDNINATISSRSSHSAADVWSVATRVLTAGTNIVLAKGTGVTGFNDLSAAQVNAEVVDVIRTDTLPDSYAADGAQPTVAQAILAIHQFLTEKSVAGTTVSVQKPDGSTTVMTFTLDDGTTPTSITRAT